MLGFVAAVPAQRLVTLNGPWVERGNTVLDTWRQRLVSLGADGVTWESDGPLWLRRPLASPGSQPAPRRLPAMVYDPVRRQVLLFSGFDPVSLAVLEDTWTYDGVAWQRRQGATDPLGRQAAAITFDTTLGRVLMFGGKRNGQQLTDTWEHDGQAWAQLAPTNPPPAGEPAMTFDTFRRRAVLTVNRLQQVFSELWEWDGVDWVRVAPGGTGPFARVGTSIAYDEVRRVTVVVGGADSFGPADISEWDGTTWQVVGASQEWNRMFPATWFDPVGGGIVVAGGAEQAHQPLFDRWRWDGVAPTATLIDERPTPAHRHLTWASWWDERRGEFVVHGNSTDWVASSDTWGWDGQAWRVIASPQQPPPRERAATAYDAARGRCLLFGGFAPRLATQSLGDLWGFDGATWQQLGTTGPQPIARSGAAMAFDRSRGVAVMFGGRAGLATSLNDTWEWDGVTWRQAAPAGPLPPQRYDHRMTYDAARARIVVHGGRGGQSDRTDTWTWDGASWQRLLPELVTVQSGVAWLGFDETRQRIVVARSTRSGQLWWEHDGAAWRQIAAPPTLAADAHAWDPVRGRHLLMRGSTLEEWTPTPAAVDRIAAACGNPAPLLGARTHPRIGDAEFGLEVIAAPGGFALFALSDATASTPVGGGCTAVLGPVLATSLRVVDARGVAVAPIPLPLAPALRGLAVFAQAGVLGAGAVSVTDGLAIVVGD